MIYLLRKCKNEVNDLIKTRFILIVTCIVAVIMINVGLSMQREYANQNNIKINDLNFKIQNMSASTNMIVKESESEEFQTEKKNITYRSRNGNSSCFSNYSSKSRSI